MSLEIPSKVWAVCCNTHVTTLHLELASAEFALVNSAGIHDEFCRPRCRVHELQTERVETYHYQKPVTPSALVQTAAAEPAEP